jgi:hypothetical protein
MKRILLCAIALAGNAFFLQCCSAAQVKQGPPSLLSDAQLAVLVEADKVIYNTYQKLQALEACFTPDGNKIADAVERAVALEVPEEAITMKNATAIRRFLSTSYMNGAVLPIATVLKDLQMTSENKALLGQWESENQTVSKQLKAKNASLPVSETLFVILYGFEEYLLPKYPFVNDILGESWLSVLRHADTAFPTLFNQA